MRRTGQNYDGETKLIIALAAVVLVVIGAAMWRDTSGHRVAGKAQRAAAAHGEQRPRRADAPRPQDPRGEQ